MPELRNLVDAERLLVTYLLADDGVAALCGTRVTTELPKTFTKQARVQIFRTGGVPDPKDVPGHLDRPTIQINAWGATKESAYDVAAETIRAILAAPKATHSGAVVTHANRLLGPVWSPDPDTDTPRYVIGAVLWIHPTGS